MKTYGGVDVYIYVILTSTLVEGEGSASRPCHFTPGERAPGIHWIGGWIDLRVGLDAVKKGTVLHCRESNRPARRYTDWAISTPSIVIKIWIAGLYEEVSPRYLTTILFNWCSGGWSPVGFTRHCGHQWSIVLAPGGYDDGEIGGMIGRGNRSTRRKPARVQFVHNPHMLPGREPGRRGGEPATNRLSYGTTYLTTNQPLNIFS
jgi:hypothetical protein